MTYRFPLSQHPLVSLILLRRIVHSEVSRAILLDGEYRRHVAAPIAVVRCGPDGNKLLVKHILVALLNELVRSGDELQRVYMVELQPG